MKSKKEIGVEYIHSADSPSPVASWQRQGRCGPFRFRLWLWCPLSSSPELRGLVGRTRAPSARQEPRIHAGDQPPLRGIE